METSEASQLLGTFPESLQLNKNELQIGREIGKGNFGVVFEGKLQHKETGAVKKVAVKMLYQGKHVQNFLIK